MEFKGFEEKDFDVFKIDGLDNRMEALIATVRPKLDGLGTHFSPTLSTLTGDELFPHVAKHARRSVNPPADTWVAFASSKRGYKMLPHFQIGLWETHVFVWFAVIYESPIKEAFGKLLENEWNQLKKKIPKNYVWSIDHTKPDVVKQSELSDSEFKDIFTRLQNVKKAEILCGIQISREDSVKMSGEQFIQTVEDTFKKLMPLYQLAQKSV
ncbi:YktB family protein [Metabacillus herbersteinensis]|uniref:UPF0637 protein ACFFIX_25430 n=1 Tax=Metabacillus herbersteinensis TaxID=283816 RepID=A0ABV6GLU9_9BACI